MPETYTIESILAADCGSATTRVFLIDTVDDQYRFIARGEAPTTTGAPYNDITVGVIQAIRQLEALVGKRFLDSEDKVVRPERLDGSGVDTFVATTSAAPPLQVVVAGLVSEVSVPSALRAAAQSHARVEDVILLSRDIPPEGHIDLLRKLQPDAVVVVGGTDGGAYMPVGALADIVALAGKLLQREQRPELVFAGNVDARTMIAEKMAGLTNFYPVDNVRPTVSVEEVGPLIEQLEALHTESKVARLPGFGRLAAWSPVSVTTSAKSFGHMMRFLAEQYGLNVLGVSLGSRGTVLASSVSREFTPSIGAGWGVGPGAAQVLHDAGLARVARWVLAEDGTETAIADAVLNRALYPRAVAVTPFEAEVDQALAREAIALCAEQAWPLTGAEDFRPYPDLAPLWDLMVLGGGFLPSQATLGQSALIVLDALQPIGVCTLAVDNAGLTQALGAVAAVQPLAAAQVLEHDALVNVGTLICPVGTGKEGDVVMRAKLTYPDKEGLELEIQYGSIEVIPLPLGEKATLQMRPSRQFDIGWGHKGRGAEADVDGGLLGIIIDARGRPLHVPHDAEERARLMQKWRWGIGY